MSYKAKCSKCGNSWETTSSRTSINCRCGAVVDFNNGECSHNKKKGECSDPKCDFHK